MLYEMTQPTPSQQMELSDTLRGVRNQKFPVGFDRARPANKLIIKMLSDDPDKRPRTNDILQEVNSFACALTSDSKSMLRKSELATSAQGELGIHK